MKGIAMALVLAGCGTPYGDPKSETEALVVDAGPHCADADGAVKLADFLPPPGCNCISRKLADAAPGLVHVTCEPAPFKP